MKKKVMKFLEITTLVNVLVIPVSFIFQQEGSVLTFISIFYLIGMLSFLNLIDILEYQQEDGEDKSIGFLKVYFFTILTPLFSYYLVFSGTGDVFLKILLLLAGAIVLSIVFTAIDSSKITTREISFKDKRENIVALLNECQTNGVKIKNGYEIFLIIRLIDTFEELTRQEKIENYEFTNNEVEKLLSNLEKEVKRTKEKNEILFKITQIENESV